MTGLQELFLNVKSPRPEDTVTGPTLEDELTKERFAEEA